jgi:ABC-type multidrug transport system permease subunit
MQNIDIHFKPSKIAIILIIGVSFGGATAIANAHFSWLTMIILYIVLFIYMSGVFYRHGLLRGQKAIKSLKYISGHHWGIEINQDYFVGKLRGDSTITLFLCVLRFEFSDNRFIKSYLLFYDSFEADSYRKLLLQLRCY